MSRDVTCRTPSPVVGVYWLLSYQFSDLASVPPPCNVSYFSQCIASPFSPPARASLLSLKIITTTGTVEMDVQRGGAFNPISLSVEVYEAQ